MICLGLDRELVSVIDRRVRLLQLLRALRRVCHYDFDGATGIVRCLDDPLQRFVVWIVVFAVGRNHISVGRYRIENCALCSCYYRVVLP